MNGDVKIGKLLCEEDIITKRQLNQALQMQVKGDKRSLGEIEEAKELPSLETLYKAEYPSRPEGYNWPRSYEQYKDQVGTLQDDMDDMYETVEEMEELIKDLQKEIRDLEKRKRDK